MGLNYDYLKGFVLHKHWWKDIKDYLNFPTALTIHGNLTVIGDIIQQSIIPVSNVLIQDNIIILNNGETGGGVSAGIAGWDIDRGTLPDAYLYFNDTDDLWHYGFSGGADYIISNTLHNHDHNLLTGMLGTLNQYNHITNAQLAALHPIETTTTIGGLINSSIETTLLINTDLFAIRDSVTGLLQKLTWLNLKTNINTFIALSYSPILTFSNGLTRTLNNIVNDLITGKAGSQTVIGGTAASETLTLSSTTNATKGKVISADEFQITPLASVTEKILTTNTTPTKISGQVEGSLQTDSKYITDTALLTLLCIEANWVLDVFIASTVGAVEGQIWDCGKYEYTFINSTLIRKNHTKQFGTTTNNLTISDDGTITLNGTATVVDDLLPTLANANTGGAAPNMTLMGASTTIRAQEFGNISATEEYQPIWQLPHSWKEGSSIEPHIHLYIPDDGTGGNIVFTMVYMWQNIDNGTMTETTVTSTPIVRAANAGINANAIATFGAIVGTGKTMSSLFAARIMRVQGGTDTFSGTTWLRSADIHIEINKLGS